MNNFKTNYADRFILNDPLDLLTPVRFDIPAKTLYARHKEKGVQDIVAKFVYEHHLEVWGDFTEGNPKKNGVNDFYNSYHEVLNSIKKDGFDEEKSFIPVSDQGLLLNGAHRTSAAICYKKPVVCKKSPTTEGQILCSFEYFRDRTEIVPSGLNRKYADLMALEYARLKKNIYMASIYEHSFQQFPRICEIFSKYGVSVVYYKDFSLTQNGKLNYIINSYSNEEWIGTVKNNYPGAHQQASLTFAGGSKVKGVLLQSCSQTNVKKAKKEIREFIGIGKPSMHITDSYEEAWINASLCFHDKSLKFINQAQVGSFNHFNLKNLSQITKRLVETSDLDIEDIIVGGSAPLSLHGLRQCRDFDILHLKSKSGLNFNEDVSSHNSYLNFYPDTLARMIFDPEEYIYAHGIKFINIETMTKMKSNRGENKDKQDIQMVKSLYKPN